MAAPAGAGCTWDRLAARLFVLGCGACLRSARRETQLQWPVLNIFCLPREMQTLHTLPGLGCLPTPV